MSDLFKDFIQRDSDICNNCFRRTHETYERNYAKRTYRRGGETHIWWDQVELPPESYTRFEEVDFIPADLASHGTHVTCICGIPDTERPVKRETALDYASRIAERFEEKRFDVDEDALVDHVKEELQRPEMQGRQDDVFAAATEQAVDVKSSAAHSSDTVDSTAIRP